MTLQKLPYAKFVDAYNKRFTNRTIFLECGKTAWEKCNTYYAFIDPVLNMPRLSMICGNHLPLPLGYNFRNFYFPVVDANVVVNWPDGADEAQALCHYLIDRCKARSVFWADQRIGDVRKFVGKELSNAA